MLEDNTDRTWSTISAKALQQLRELNGDPAGIDTRTRRIVALWRLFADGYNGGFLQFYCNWGEEAYEFACAALQEIGAHATLSVVLAQRRCFDRVLQQPFEDPWQIAQLLKPDEAELSERLDRDFWDVGVEIPPRAVRWYGDDSP